MLSKAKMPRQSGLSFVEVLVALAILTALAALGVTSYTEMIQNSRIRTVAESIQNGIQLARAEAVKRNTMVKFQLGDSSSWIVCVVTAPADNCADNPGSADYIQGRKASEGGTSDATVTTSPAANLAIVFNGLGLIPAGSNPFTQVEVDIDPATLSAEASRELRILVGAGGSTRMCDPSPKLLASDPRAC